jgi:hypothetical protein
MVTSYVRYAQLDMHVQVQPLQSVIEMITDVIPDIMMYLGDYIVLHVMIGDSVLYQASHMIYQIVHVYVDGVKHHQVGMWSEHVLIALSILINRKTLITIVFHARSVTTHFLLYLTYLIIAAALLDGMDGMDNERCI